MKYQVIEISEYLINVNEYNTAEEALTCFSTWIKDAKENPLLCIKDVYLTVEHGIMAEWHSKE